LDKASKFKSRWYFLFLRHACTAEQCRLYVSDVTEMMSKS